MIYSQFGITEYLRMKQQKYPISKLDSQELGRTKGENSIKFEFKVNVVSKTV